MTTEHTADRAIFVVFLLLLVWAPIPLGSNRPWAVAILEVGLFALAIAWLWLWAFGQVRIHAPFRKAWPAIALLGCWLLLLLVQITPIPDGLIRLVSATRAAILPLEPLSSMHALSLDRYASIDFILKTCAYAAAFCLTLVLVRERSRLQTIAFVILVAALLQSLYASFLHLAGAHFELFFAYFPHNESARGTFVNRNHLAGYLELCLALGIGMMIATLRGGRTHTWKQRLRDTAGWLLSSRVLLRVGLIVMVVALVMTRSRMGNAAFFASLLIAGVIGLALSKYAARSTVILLVSLIVIDVFVVGSWFGVDNLIKRYGQTTLYRAAEPQAGGAQSAERQSGREQSVEDRMEPGLFALKMIKDHPLVGGGGGTFYVSFPRYRPAEVEKYYYHAHNDYIQFATETGLIGFGLMGLLVLSSFAITLGTLKQRRDSLARGVAFGVMMGIISIMIHSWVDFNLQIPANALLFVVLLALGWIAYSLDRRSEEGPEEKYDG